MSAWSKTPLSLFPSPAQASAVVNAPATTVEYVDIGPNLTNAAFAHDLEAVLSRSFAAGVRTLILTSVEPATWAANLAIIQRFAGRRDLPTLKMTCGVHPNWSQHFRQDTLARMRTFIRLHREYVVAIGECGLDYFRHPETRQQQLHAFEQQLELAVEVGLPLFLHDRDSQGDMGMLLSKWALLGARFVIHCFTGSREELQTYVRLGAYIGFTGFIGMNKRGAAMRQWLSEGREGLLPLDRVLIDSDAPYMLHDRTQEVGPVQRMKGGYLRNEPCFVPLVAETLAECYGVEAA